MGPAIAIGLLILIIGSLGLLIRLDVKSSEKRNNAAEEMLKQMKEKAYAAATKEELNTVYDELDMAVFGAKSIEQLNASKNLRFHIPVHFSGKYMFIKGILEGKLNFLSQINNNLKKQ